MREPATTLVIRVTPRSRAPGVGPWRDGVLQVRVPRPPTDGEATLDALAAVAVALKVPPSAVRLVSGRRSRHKRVAVAGLTADQVADLLARLADGPN
jgi:uncharacterized protein YggU (UPF0235/DUF167 family)